MNCFINCSVCVKGKVLYQHVLSFIFSIQRCMVLQCNLNIYLYKYTRVCFTMISNILQTRKVQQTKTKAFFRVRPWKIIHITFTVVFNSTAWKVLPVVPNLSESELFHRLFFPLFLFFFLLQCKAKYSCLY